MSCKITGTGSYIPSVVTKNDHFQQHEFLNSDGSLFPGDNEATIQKFKAITGIEERRYINDKLNTSDIAVIAAEDAIKNAGIDKETLDYIIVAHNYGDVKAGCIQSDTVPSLATRVKSKLRIKNPKCVGYDVLFGCPGWIEGMIQANAFIKAGIAKKCLVIGAEALSRVVDKHDRDSMIFSDGAGATILEASSEEGGILSHQTATFSFQEAEYIYFGKSNHSEAPEDVRYIKMNGRKIYEFALVNVPKAMKECLEQSGKNIEEVKKIFIHQANKKMDDEIIKRFYRQYKMAPPENVMPMTIQELGNSSVATVPTLFDLVNKGKIADQHLEKGDIVIFASVGAGMNINAITYQV
ncbi:MULTISPECIES: 3-oxoacyl-ACP synthase III family protein [Christiangramia]|uniref:3-oxoacyl-[acyl-carrier-protein] synthase, KASIII n=1 Tax=Christiangramia flava JLT2011 TaxID=1229726 RepID=A0A1L7I1U0_9FLAO|nr:ketoacyl-ACP synthase III [Christiangramia flava]APU67551.1 3-oxoacyl-[acyl-carrier-protein] synthase, KASIII [Christiangramia flava JLT2011]OSS40137.1 3-oxoacyl-[acyl-carrier-protein] synthase, KASIII [Christiangramia flava JLT2011]